MVVREFRHILEEGTAESAILPELARRTRGERTKIKINYMKLWKTALAGIVVLAELDAAAAGKNSVSESQLAVCDVQSGSAAISPPKEDSLLVMFWNCENFFDYTDSGTGVSDWEFSSRGSRHWTAKRFYAKCNVFAKSLLYIADTEGCLPDVVGLAEIENAGVLRRLLSSTVLRKLDYRFIHYDSPDHRGIDCALLYRSSRLTPLSSKPCHIDSLATRDILLAQFVTAGGDSLAILVNHHPSKYSGGASEGLRTLAMRRLRFLSDSLENALWRVRVAVGDFNEQPPNPIFDLLQPSLLLLNAPPGPFPGSIRFNGNWELIDLAFVSPPLGQRAHLRVRPLPFLLEKDSAHSGLRPLRTFSGPRWKGGFSDHLPILVTLRL